MVTIRILIIFLYHDTYLGLPFHDIRDTWYIVAPLVDGLPKLVANIDSQFQQLVNTALAVSSLVKRIPIKVTCTPKLISQSWGITEP